MTAKWKDANPLDLWLQGPVKAALHQPLLDALVEHFATLHIPNKGSLSRASQSPLDIMRGWCACFAQGSAAHRSRMLSSMLHYIRGGHSLYTV